MEVKVEVGLSKGLEGLLNRFINAIEGAGTSSNVPKACHARPVDAAAQEPVELKAETVKKAESVSDVEMAKPVEEPNEEDTDEDINYPALRKEIKKLGIKLVQAKKQSEVKALTTKYGYSKMDDLPDDKLVQYLEDLKEIQNG